MGQNALFINFRTTEEKSEFDGLLTSWIGYPKGDATPEALVNYFKTCVEDISPRVCAILCHGEANQANPYLSSLQLCEKDLTHLDLRIEKFELNGTCVVLGACETDMASPIQGFADEHLSLASAFLSMGVSSVIGNLWKVGASQQKKLLEMITESTHPPFEVLRDQQQEWLNAYKKSKKQEKENFGPFFFLPFRILGIPF